MRENIDTVIILLSYTAISIRYYHNSIVMYNYSIRKLPVDHKCGIRQSFTTSLLLTPLFFLDFFGFFEVK